MDTFRIGVIGKIAAGGGDNTKGWYILIQPDSAFPSQYYLYTSPNEDFSGHGFDSYFLSLEEVSRHLEYCKYEIEWFDETTDILK